MTASVARGESVFFGAACSEEPGGFVKVCGIVVKVVGKKRVLVAAPGAIAAKLGLEEKKAEVGGWREGCKGRVM